MCVEHQLLKLKLRDMSVCWRKGMSVFLPGAGPHTASTRKLVRFSLATSGHAVQFLPTKKTDGLGSQVWHTGLTHRFGRVLPVLSSLSLSISNSVSLSTSEIWEVLKNLPRYAAFLPAQHRSRGSPPSERTSKFQLSRLCDTEKKWRDKRDTKTSHVWRKQTEISPKSADPACSRGSASEKTLQGAWYGSRRTEARARSFEEKGQYDRRRRKKEVARLSDRS